MSGKLLTTARAILSGWAMLFAVSYLIGRPLLYWLGPRLDLAWIPTVRVALECAGLGAAGWTVGRLHRSDGRNHAAPALVLFALMLAGWNFGMAPDTNLPWLIRLTRDAAGSSRYWESFITTLSIQALLFGSIFAGAGLARPARMEPLSIGDSGVRG